MLCFIVSLIVGACIFLGVFYLVNCNDVDCTPCILEWLQQPFEGE